MTTHQLTHSGFGLQLLSLPLMKFRLKGRRSDTVEDIQHKSQKVLHIGTESDCSKRGRRSGSHSDYFGGDGFKSSLSQVQCLLQFQPRNF